MKNELRSKHLVSENTAQFFRRFTQENQHVFPAEAASTFRADIAQFVGSVSGLPEDMEAPLQPWPTWIDPKQREQAQTTILALARLFRSVPQRIFGGDAKKIADFLAMDDPLMVTLLLAEPNFLEETICRGDFIETASGFKLVEFNIGNLGGWQHSAFEDLYLRQPAVSAFLHHSGLSAACRDSIGALFRHVIRHTMTTPLATESYLNLLIVASDEGSSSVDSHPLAVYERTFSDQLKTWAPQKKGRIFVRRVSDLEFSKGELHIENQRIHAVIEQNDTRPSSAIFRCFKAGLVNCYTSPLGMILGDKKLLGLLSSLQDTDIFTPEEQQLLRDHLPWTRKLTEPSLSFKGDSGPTFEILRQHRTSLVLKQGSGFGGTEVYIGPFTDPHTWSTVARQAIESGSWVAQEFLEGIPHSYPRNGGEPEPHDVAWGFYVFGQEFGGTFLRMAPKGESPVLNIAQGAQIGLAFEVAEWE